jgi:hypothetical protein
MEEKKEKLEMPAKTLSVKIGSGEYEIKLLTNGQRIDIESNKIRLTNGTHKDLLMGSASAKQAWVLSEAISIFSVLIASLQKDLNVSSLLDLDEYQSRSLIKAFEKFYEWDQKWREYINQELDEED